MGGTLLDAIERIHGFRNKPYYGPDEFKYLFEKRDDMLIIRVTIFITPYNVLHIDCGSATETYSVIASIYWYE
jgi:hypothetical protein